MDEQRDILAESESQSSRGDRPTRGLKAARDLNALLRGDVTEKKHAKAAETLQRLRDVVAGDGVLCKEAVAHLECVAVSLDRTTRDLRNRAVAMHQTAVGSTDKHANERIMRCVLELNAKANNIFDSFSLTYVILCHATRHAGGALAVESTRAVADVGWWELARDGRYVARAFAGAAAHRTQQQLHIARLGDVQSDAALYAQHVRNAILYENITHDDSSDFLTLDAVSTSTMANALASGQVAKPDSFVRAALAAGESELGQTILRDMVVSFSIPTAVLGVRGTLLIPRATAARVVDSYPEISQLAHETAMAGSVWVFENVEDDMRVACAVLAGLACLLAGHDDLRSPQSNPFAGLVTLPFLVGRPSATGEASILHNAEVNSWTVYQHDASGGVRTKCAASGLAGLFVCVSCLLSDRAAR